MLEQDRIAHEQAEAQQKAVEADEAAKVAAAAEEARMKAEEEAAAAIEVGYSTRAQF